MRVSFGSLRAFASIARLTLAVSVLGLAAPATSHAQVRRDTTKAPTPAAAPRQTEMEQLQAQQMEMMGPMMGQMTQAMMQGMLAVLAKPETAERMATFTKNYYDALVAKGFSRDDAMRIVMAHGIPNLQGGR